VSPGDPAEGRNPREQAQSVVVARNAALNLLTQTVLMVVAFWAIPRLTHGLGEERFGFLTILWAFTGYFGLLDLGVSRAVTKFVAESLAADDRARAIRMSWTALTVSAAAGVVGATIIAGTASFWTTTVLHVPASMESDATTALRIAALGVPFMLASGVARGVQMACQSFEQVNALQFGLGVVQWGGAVLLAVLGHGLTAIMVLTVIARIVVAVLAAVLTAFLIPGLAQQRRLWDAGSARTLLGFGGWVTVSQVVSPLFSYLDRLLIGAFLSLSAVALYAVPQEGVLRALVIPMSLTLTLFPAMSGTGRDPASREASQRLYYRSVKYMVLLMLPLTILLGVFGNDLLALWIGSSFAEGSGNVVTILSAGFFAATLAQLPTAALPAYGRPDLPAKFHLAELPLMLTFNVILIPVLGIAGAALTWSIRLFLDAGLLFRAVFRLQNESRAMVRRLLGWSGMTMQLIWCALMGGILAVIDDPFWKILLTATFLAVHVTVSWRRGFDSTDKQFLQRLIRSVAR
jgi:O-antigen/teichoic acid export membrane protein